jgi:hypothetical protein
VASVAISRGQEFDRDITANGFLACPKDIAHATGAKHAGQYIGVDYPCADKIGSRCLFNSKFLGIQMLTSGVYFKLTLDMIPILS